MSKKVNETLKFKMKKNIYENCGAYDLLKSMNQWIKHSKNIFS